MGGLDLEGGEGCREGRQVWKIPNVFYEGCGYARCYNLFVWRWKDVRLCVYLHAGAEFLCLQAPIGNVIEYNTQVSRCRY